MALVVALVATPAEAADGTLAGTVPKAPTAEAGAYYRPAVVAYRLDQPGMVVATTPTAGASYRLRVPAGLWAVQSPRWVKGQLTNALAAVPVAGGRTSTVRAETKPPAVRLASAAWTSSGLAEPEVTGGIADLLASELANATGTCTTASGERGMASVVDRDSRAFREVLKEIRLGESRYASPEFRAMAKRARANMSAWAPTHRLTGTVTASGGRLTATARVVNAKTGKTEWTKTYTGPDTGDGFFSLFDTMASDAVTALCKVEKEPETGVRKGYFIGPVSGGEHTITGLGIGSNDDGSSMGTATPKDVCDITVPFTLTSRSTGGRQTFTPTSPTGGTTTYETTMPMTGFVEKGKGTYTLELKGTGGTIRTKVTGELTLPGSPQSYKTTGVQVFSLQPATSCS